MNKSAYDQKWWNRIMFASMCILLVVNVYVLSATPVVFATKYIFRGHPPAWILDTYDPAFWLMDKTPLHWMYDPWNAFWWHIVVGPI